MSSPSAPPSRATGLPPGVAAGPLGRRALAQLIDLLVPTVLVVVATSAALGSEGAVGIATIVGTLLLLGWFVLVWGMFATRAAGPGMRLMRLQLVGLRDGRPIGWGRFLVRSLVLTALAATGIGLVLMLIFLVRDIRRQGLHDLFAESVVIVERPLAPPRLPRHAMIEEPEQDGRPAAPAAPLTPAAPVTPVTPIRPVAPVPPPERAPDVEPASYGEPEESAATNDESVRVRRLQRPGLSDPVAEPESRRVAPADPQAGSSPAPGGAPERPAGEAADQGWVAVLDDGREVELSGMVLLGRNPQPRTGEEEAQLIKITDESRTVSKTHLSLTVGSRGLVVMDRGSTNGSTLTDPAGVSIGCPAGDDVEVTDGSILSFGDHWLRIEHRA